MSSVAPMWSGLVLHSVKTNNTVWNPNFGPSTDMFYGKLIYFYGFSLLLDGGSKALIDRLVDGQSDVSENVAGHHGDGERTREVIVLVITLVPQVDGNLLGVAGVRGQTDLTQEGIHQHVVVIHLGDE